MLVVVAVCVCERTMLLTTTTVGTLLTQDTGVNTIGYRYVVR